MKIKHHAQIEVYHFDSGQVWRLPATARIPAIGATIHFDSGELLRVTAVEHDLRNTMSDSGIYSELIYIYTEVA